MDQFLKSDINRALNLKPQLESMKMSAGLYGNGRYATLNIQTQLDAEARNNEDVIVVAVAEDNEDNQKPYTIQFYGSDAERVTVAPAEAPAVKDEPVKLNPPVIIDAVETRHEQ